MDGDEDFKDHLEDLTLGKFEPSSIGNDDLVINKFIPMKVDQIFELIVDDFELFSNKLFKQKDISIFIDIIKPVNVCT